MIKPQVLSYVLIITGSALAIYGQSGEEEHVTMLIIGIMILMFGLYRISSKIPSKFDQDVEDKKQDTDDV